MYQAASYKRCKRAQTAAAAAGSCSMSDDRAAGSANKISCVAARFAVSLDQRSQANSAEVCAYSPARSTVQFVRHDVFALLRSLITCTEHTKPAPHSKDETRERTRPCQRWSASAAAAVAALFAPHHRSWSRRPQHYAYDK